jgi:hypothetical protein
LLQGPEEKFGFAGLTVGFAAAAVMAIPYREL